MNDSKYWTGYLDEVIRTLVLILPKTSGYLKRFNKKDWNKNKNNKLSSLPIDGDKLLENYETICTKIEDLDKCACKIIDKQMMTIFLRLIKISLFFFLKNGSYKYFILIRNNSKECMVCHYWFFNHLNFKILFVMIALI